MADNRNDGRVGHPLLRRATSRRTVLAGAGFGAAFLAGGLKTASAFMVEESSLHGLLGDQPYVPPRDGVLHWETLGRVDGEGWGVPAQFAEDVLALNGQNVTVDGFMLPYDNDPVQERFMLMGFRSHCPFCLPGGMRSMIDVVSAGGGVAVTEGLVTVTGTLSVHQGRDEYEILYTIDDGVARHLAA